MNTAEFQELIWDQSKQLYRDMPWRRDTRPYYVMVSEIMLQQTQVERVIPKFEAFIRAFPSEDALARASLAEVLTAWSGLGYNRRAKFLHEAARKIVGEYNGAFPETLQQLVLLPGIGPNTAGAILAYSFNQPVAFVETNVRTVYFHHFFQNQEQVRDSELRELVAATIDSEHPREWYWALMDYGSFLKRSGVGRNSKSAHYKRQSPLKGSVREVRGQIIQVLTKGDRSNEELQRDVQADERFAKALEGLVADGLVLRVGGRLHLAR